MWNAELSRPERTGDVAHHFSITVIEVDRSLDPQMID
jgi:hypothetical protein